MSECAITPQTQRRFAAKGPPVYLEDALEEHQQWRKCGIFKKPNTPNRPHAKFHIERMDTHRMRSRIVLRLYDPKNQTRCCCAQNIILFIYPLGDRQVGRKGTKRALEYLKLK